MSRIAAAALIAVAVLAFNGTLLHGAFAKDFGRPGTVLREAAVEPLAMRSAKVLSLLLVLESLRQAPVALDAPKG